MSSALFFLKQFKIDLSRFGCLSSYPFSHLVILTKKDVFLMCFFFFVILTHYLENATWIDMGEAISRSRNLVSL